jgi:hypothetical protein
VECPNSISPVAVINEDNAEEANRGAFERKNVANVNEDARWEYGEKRPSDN